MAKVQFDVLRTIDAASLTGAYQNFGAPLTQNWRAFKCTNNTDGDILLSLNGTDDNMFVPQYSFTLYDLATNAPNVQNSDGFVFASGTQFEIKTDTAATTGDVWLEGIYATGV